MKIARFALVCLSSCPVLPALAAQTIPVSGSGTAAATTEPAEIAALRAKAEHGNSIAQYNLGLVYLEGRGTAKDPIEAFVWLAIAAENGSTAKALDTLRDSLTPEQIAEARRRIDAMRVHGVGLKPTPVAGEGRTTTTRVAGSDATENRAPAARPTAMPSSDGGAMPAPAAEIFRLSGELERARQDNSQLRSEVASLRDRIGAADARSAAAARAETQVAALTTEIASSRAEAAKLRIELEAAKQNSAANAEAGRREQDKEIARLRAQLEDARQTMAKTDERVRQSADEKARAEASANAAAGETVNLREQVRALTAEREAARTEKTAALARVGELERAVAAATTAKSEAAAAELTAARNDIDTWKAKAAQAAADQAQAANALAVQVTEVQMLQRARDAARTERDQAQTELSGLRRKVAAAEAQLAEAKSEREQFAKREAAAQEALNAATRERDEARTSEQATEKRRQELEAKAVATTAELAKAEQRATQLAGDNDALQRRLSAADATLAAERSQAAQAAGEEASAKRRELVDTRQKLAAANQEMAALRTQVAASRELAAQVKQLESDKAALAGRAETARAQSQKATESARDFAAVTAAKGDVEQKLATALRAYALLEKERDELAGRLADRAAQGESPTASASGPAGQATRVATVEREPAGVPLNAPPPARLAGVPMRPPVPVETRTASDGRDVSHLVTKAPTTQAVAAAPRYHTVALGETLSGISRRYYGTPTRWVEIYEANRDELHDEHTLIAGQTLRIP